MQPQEISKVRSINYNTVRSILSNFYQNGRINIKKKTSGYTKASKLSTNVATEEVETSSQTHGSDGPNSVELDRFYRKQVPQFKLDSN